MKISIIRKYPIQTQEGGFETAAFEYIHGETLEQLVSRVLYELVSGWDAKTRKSYVTLAPYYMRGTPKAVIELRVEVEG